MNNKAFTVCTRAFIRIFATIFVLGMCFFCILSQQVVARLTYLRNTPAVDCSQLVSNYGTDLKALAFTEWLEMQDDYYAMFHLDLDDNVSRLGSYQCFCQNELINLDQPADSMYTLSYTQADGSTGYMTEPICRNYETYAVSDG